MAGKFAKQTAQFSVGLGELFNRSIRQALLAGLSMAVASTKHDSSNAAVHWLIAAKSKSRPGARRYGKLRDLRATSDKPGVPPVGKRRSFGAQEAAAYRFVRERELKEVIDKLVIGRRPVVDFYFYTAIEEGSEYYNNAEIEKAGKAAVGETARIYQNRIAAGQARKNPL